VNYYAFRQREIVSELLFGSIHAIIALALIMGFFFGIWTVMDILFSKPGDYWWRRLFPKDDDCDW